MNLVIYSLLFIILILAGCKSESEKYFEKGYFEKDPKLKIEYYSKAIELEKNYCDAYNNRGQVYSQLEDFEHALNDYNQAINCNPKFFQAFNNRAVLYGKLGLYLRAIEDYNKAILLNPNDASYFFNRGIDKFHLKKHLDALKDFDKSIYLDSSFYWAYDMKGVVYDALENYPLALINYKKALDLAPNELKLYLDISYSYVLQDSFSHSLNYLDILFQKGFNDFEFFKRDSMWSNVKNKKEFISLIGKYNN